MNTILRMHTRGDRCPAMRATVTLFYCSDPEHMQYDSAWAWRDGLSRDGIEGDTMPIADCHTARLRLHQLSALHQGWNTCLSHVPV
jgi:hypothetical protein